MDDKIIAQLEKKESREDKFHDALLDHAKRLVRMSRAKMSSYYPDWDMQDSVFRGEKCPDLDDRKAMQRGKPGKMIIPNTYAQVMTFTSFQFLMFNQNRRFFELQGTGPEDSGMKKEDSELLLERDLRHNQFNGKLFQFLLDVGRFGPGIIETNWQVDKTKAWITPEPVSMNTPSGLATTVQGAAGWQEFTRFEGNEIKNVSPYRFFPDTRHALTNFKRGEFCAVEEEYGMGQLRKMAANKEVAGLDHIQPLKNSYVKDRGGETRWSLLGDDKAVQRFDSNNDSSVALITKLQIYLIPSKFTYGEKKKLGPEEFPVLYDLWYANDNRVIKCEPNRNWHGEFSWNLGQFTPDMHRIVNFGLADLIYPIQDAISWFINSHITSVRRVIGNRLIIDPKIVETKTLDGEGDIYLKKGYGGPLDRAVGQLRVQDVTGGHMGDADTLNKITEMVTGVNGNAMGQYNSGRRSAQEARVVTAGAAGRMKMHGQLLWESALGQMGKQMHSNLRQSLSFESFNRIVGSAFAAPQGTDPEAFMSQRYAAYKGTPEDVICGDDFFMFDSTLASEKGFIAQSLQELLVSVMTNPVAAQTWDISAKALMEEIQRLRGVSNVGQFSLSQRVKAGLETPPMPTALPQPAI